MKRIVLVVLLVALAVPARGADLSKQCPGGIEDFFKMLTMNPFDNTGRCFETWGLQPLQLLSRTKGIYITSRSPEPVALIDFGKKSASASFFRGVVRGKGAFQYTAASGALVTIHRLEVLNIEQSR